MTGEHEGQGGNKGSYGGAFMPDPTDAGILGVYDATDVIQEIKYNLRRYEIKEKEGEPGKYEWVKPQPELKKFQRTKSSIKEEYGEIQDFIDYLESRGGHIEGYTEGKEGTTKDDDIITFYDAITEIVKPLVNRIGEHDIINLLNSFMNRNIYLTNMPGKDSDKFVYRFVNKFAHDLINLLGVNANKYEIQEPKHITLIVYIVVPNVFAAMQTPVEAGGRTTLEKIMGEQKVIRERIHFEEGRQSH